MDTNLTKQKKEKYLEIGQLATGLFHDIINPLSAVLLNLEEIVNNKDLNSKDKLNYSRQALISAYYLNQIISDISSQIQQAEIKEFFDLKELIKSSQTLFNYQLTSNNIRFIYKATTNIQLIGFKTKLCRVINNLISNAIRACQGTKNAYLKIILELNSKELKINIIDNGVGVDKAMQRNLFQEFKSTKNNKTNLSGFGLYSSKLMINKYFQGTIVYKENNNDQGSIFSIIIPRKLVKIRK